MLTSTNNGSTYDASGYLGVRQSIGDGGTTATMSITEFELTNSNTSNGTSRGISGTVNIYGVNSTTKRKMVTSETAYFNTSDGSIVRTDMGGARDSTADIDAIRFLMSAGNMTSGVIRLYGVSKS